LTSRWFASCLYYNATSNQRTSKKQTERGEVSLLHRDRLQSRLAESTYVEEVNFFEKLLLVELELSHIVGPIVVEWSLLSRKGGGIEIRGTVGLLLLPEPPS
jgi:hypothetical protein